MLFVGPQDGRLETKHRWDAGSSQQTAHVPRFEFQHFYKTFLIQHHIINEILVSEIIPFQKRGEPPNFGCSLTGLSCPRYRFGSSRVSGPVTWAPTHGRRRYSCKHKLRFIFTNRHPCTYETVEDPKLAKSDPEFVPKLNIS